MQPLALPRVYRCFHRRLTDKKQSCRVTYRQLIADWENRKIESTIKTKNSRYGRVYTPQLQGYGRHFSTAGSCSASWTLPLGITGTACFKSANQIVLNKALIIIICALHFLEFPLFAALRMHTQFKYDAWTLTPESQQIGVFQQKQVSLERKWEKKWKWQANCPAEGTISFVEGCVWCAENIKHVVQILSQISLSMSIPRASCWHFIFANQKASFKLLGFAPIWTLIGWFNRSAPGGQVQERLRLLWVAEW